MSTWEDQMQAVCDSATKLVLKNVLDISFGDGRSAEVYVAISQEERAQGLANIPTLDLDGMLFCYSSPSFVPYTMADMLIDLDIAWYSADGSLIKLGTFKAGSADALLSPQAFSYVLEAPAGTLLPTCLKVRI